MQHEAHIGALATLSATAIPVALYILSIYGLYYYLVRRFDPFHIALLIATVAPVVTVVGYEIRGHRHQARMLAEE